MSSKLSHVPESPETCYRFEVATLTHAFKQLYVTSGGYSHEEVDHAAYRLIESLQNFLNEATKQYANIPELDITIIIPKFVDYTLSRTTTKIPVSKLNNSRLILNMESRPPAATKIRRFFGVEIPVDSEVEGDIVISDTQKQVELFSARISDLIPDVNSSVQMRLNIFANRILSECIRNINELGKNELIKKGYKSQ